MMYSNFNIKERKEEMKKVNTLSSLVKMRTRMREKGKNTKVLDKRIEKLNGEVLQIRKSY